MNQHQGFRWDVELSILVKIMWVYFLCLEEHGLTLKSALKTRHRHIPRNPWWGGGLRGSTHRGTQRRGTWVPSEEGIVNADWFWRTAKQNRSHEDMGLKKACRTFTQWDDPWASTYCVLLITITLQISTSSLRSSDWKKRCSETLSHCNNCIKLLFFNEMFRQCYPCYHSHWLFWE